MSFLASGLFLLGIRKREENVPTRAERKEPKVSMREELREGLALGARQPASPHDLDLDRDVQLLRLDVQAILAVYLVRSLGMARS